MTPITTRRLYIRTIQPSDWQALKKITRDFAQSPYVYYDHAFPEEDIQLRAITKAFSETGMFFSVILQESNEMIGYICMHDDGDSYDMGYCFHSDFHHKGYAQEACRALMEAFEKQYNVTVFTAGTALKNIPSYTLLIKLGFQLQYTEPTSFHKDNDGNDIVFEGGRFVRHVK